MPIGKYQNFEACVIDHQKKGLSIESANRICGEIKKRTELSEFYVFCQDIDLSQMEDSELENKNFELLTTAKQTDPRYGDFSYSKEMLEAMAENFNKNILGQEIAVDLNHESTTKAYAWIKPQSMYVDKSLKLEGQYSLFAQLYRYTPEGKELVKTGAFRYFSVAIRPFMERFIGGVKKKIKNVLVGLALTNRPVIKDMVPTYSETTYLSFNKKNMEIIKLLLSELKAKKIVTKAEKDLLAKSILTLSEEEVAEVAQEVAEVSNKPEQSEEEIAADAKSKEEAEAKAKEEADAKAAAEAKLSESERKFSEQARELSEMKNKMINQEIDKELSDITISDEKGIATGFFGENIASAKEFMLTLSEDQRSTFISLIKGIKSINLSETGSSDTTKLSSDAFDKQVKELAEKESITYGQALKKLS